MRCAILASVLFTVLLVSLTAFGQGNYADSDTGPLNTIAPIFSGMNAIPEVAHQGQRVILTFAVSEQLAENPQVTVNGFPAYFVKRDTIPVYTYAYDVVQDDPFGAAAITVTGADASGNTGTFTDKSVLEIVTQGHGLPLSAWPVFVALLLAAILMTVLRRRRGSETASLFILGVLVSGSLLAEVPQVSNVTFVQGPDGSGGTKVDIYYDLVAPNGACTITAALSKNAGADGFPYPITSVSGDIFQVETGTNHHMVWTVAKDYPNEDIPEARIRVTADEAFSLVFLTDTHADMKCSELSLRTIAQWIAAQAKSLNILYVAHLGDVGDERGSGSLVEMLQLARSALQAIADSGIPLSIAIGNHDYQPLAVDDLRSADAFNRADTFGREFYYGKPWFGGTFEEQAGDPGPFPGGTVNHYNTLEIYGRPYLFLTLEHYPRDKVLDWANNLVQNVFPDHEVIVTTHAYLTEYGVLSTGSYNQQEPGPEYSNSGNSMWERYFKSWNNLRLILNGHFINEPRQAYLQQVGLFGNTVHSHFFNYQNWGYRLGGLYYVTSRGLHQAATIRILTVYPALNKVVVRNYTPSANMTIEEASPATHIFRSPENKKTPS